MIATLQAVQSALAPLGYPIHLFTAEAPTGTTPQVPYLVLEVGYSGLLPDELPVCGPDGDMQFDLRVKAVGYPADSPPKVQARVRNLLAPGLGESRLSVPGRLIDVSYTRTEIASQVDMDVVVPTFNRHPSWGVDTYEVRVQVSPVPPPPPPDEESSSG